jgi:hypothetical protein
MENMSAIEAVNALRVLGLAMPQAVYATRAARDNESFTYWGVCVTWTGEQGFSITDPSPLAGRAA